MGEITTGVRRVLSRAGVYNAFVAFLGARKARERFVAEFVKPSPNASIIDIGCGPGSIVEFLPQSVSYLGVDRNANYIHAANARFGNRAKFVCMDANDIQSFLVKTGPFDIALLMAVLHHLSDQEAARLIGIIAAALRPAGLLVTFDCAYTSRQSRISRILIDLDRGQNVRSPEGYASLATQFFADVRSHIRHDLLRVPYTHVILSARKPHAQPLFHQMTEAEQDLVVESLRRAIAT